MNHVVGEVWNLGDEPAKRGRENRLSCFGQGCDDRYDGKR